MQTRALDERMTAHDDPVRRSRPRRGPRAAAARRLLRESRGRRRRQGRRLTSAARAEPRLERRLTDPDTPNVEFFASQVRALSRGTLRVHVIPQAAGDAVPDTEERIARMVRDGKLDLGWIGARAWDELGVSSFQALQAPFLITSYPLLDRVTTSPLATRMLAGLARQHVIGLALVPELLRHPAGFRHPLSSLADFDGARIRALPSRAGDALLRALGATPVHESNRAFATDRRSDGEETSFGRVAVVGAPSATANVAFSRRRSPSSWAIAPSPG